MSNRESSIHGLRVVEATATGVLGRRPAEQEKVPSSQPSQPKHSASPKATGESVQPARSGRRRLGIALAWTALGAAAAAGVAVGLSSVGDQPGGQASERAERGAAYKQELRRELVEFSATRTAKLRRLEQADTPRQQQAALQTLATVHQRAARSLARTRPPAPLRRQGDLLVQAMRRLAGAYRGLAHLAVGPRLARYRSGRDAVRSAEADLRRRLRAIDAGAA